MSAAWLVLYLGGLIHLLCLAGCDLAHPTTLLMLAPVVAVLVLPPLLRRHPGLLPPSAVRIAGLAGFACTLLFVKAVYLEAWDPQRWGEAGLLATTGIGTLLPVLATTGEAGPGTWLWVAAWTLAGWLDPALPLLGAGLAGLVQGPDPGPGSAPAQPALHTCGAWPCLFLLGLALPKPWWDFGPEPGWVWPGIGVGLGAALAACGPCRTRLARLPTAVLGGALGALFVLYAPAFGLAWGLVLGLAAGAVWDRLLRPLRLDAVAGAFLAGLLISFSLHANAWIPGLRHLIWLGN